MNRHLGNMAQIASSRNQFLTDFPGFIAVTAEVVYGESRLGRQLAKVLECDGHASGVVALNVATQRFQLLHNGPQHWLVDGTQVLNPVVNLVEALARVLLKTAANGVEQDADAGFYFGNKAHERSVWK